MEKNTSSSTVYKDLIYSSPNLKNWTLDDNDLERECPLDRGRHRVKPTHDLGILERLPLEVISEILVQVDIRSLLDFRRVNQRALQVVDSVPMFQTISGHGSASLRGILSIGTGSWISCRDLFYTLTNSKCESCDDFGGFIYVLTCNRVCFLCLSEKPRYLPLLASEVERSYGLGRDCLPSLPSMISLPGCYSPNERSCRTRLVLIDPESAYRAGVALYTSASSMEQHVSAAASKRIEKYHERMSRKARGQMGPSPRRPPDTIARDGQASNPRRFMAIVRAPWVNPLTNSAEWGFHCIGCERQYRCRPLHWRRKYITGTFNAHITQCGPIKNGIHDLNAVTQIKATDQLPPGVSIVWDPQASSDSR